MNGINQLHDMMSRGRTQATPVSAECFEYAGKEMRGFIAPADYGDALMIDGYTHMADFILVFDKCELCGLEPPDMKRGQIKARGRNMRIMKGLEDASSYTLTLKIDP